MIGQTTRGDEPKEQHFNQMFGMQMQPPMPPEESSENKSISTLTFIKSLFYKTIDDFNRKVVELNRYNLSEEVECIKDLIKNLWEQTEKINEVIRNKYPEIKVAQDAGRGKKESEDTEDKPKECPECGEPMNGDTCPECGYSFNS